MIIISWDVGVIHLAYCVLKYKCDSNGNCDIRIIDWNEINLIEDNRISLTCCGKTKTKINESTEICGNNAAYYLNTGKHNIGFCKTHVLQANDYWSADDIGKLFVDSDKTHKCNYLKKGGNECGKNAKYKYVSDNSNLCSAHYQMLLKKKLKDSAPQPIKNLIVKKYPTSQLQFNLIKKLDELSLHFSKLGIQEVIIENQPSQKNPKMKSIANTLFDYFLIRGCIDKIHNLNIDIVRFMCPSNKLKVNNENTLEVFKSNSNSKTKYKLTKQLSIVYTKQLLKNNQSQLDYLELFKKKDDLCDCYLQGRYYLQFLKYPTHDIKQNRSSKCKSKKIDKINDNVIVI